MALTATAGPMTVVAGSRAATRSHQEGSHRVLRNFAAWSQRDAHHVDGRCAGVIILTDEFRAQAKVLQLKCAMRLSSS
jgi:hypothetical protein